MYVRVYHFRNRFSIFSSARLPRLFVIWYISCKGYCIFVNIHLFKCMQFVQNCAKDICVAMVENKQMGIERLA